MTVRNVTAPLSRGFALCGGGKLARMMKRTLLLLSLILTACATTTPVSTDQNRGFTIIHMNDTYRVGDVEDGTRGGFGRVVTVIRQLQAEGRDVRVTHGGDLLFPSLESQIWFGGQMVRALNFVDDLAPVYFVAGNHEFDAHEDDVAYFINAVRSSHFDWVGDNYWLTTDDEDADATVKSDFVFEAAGRRVGVFALTLHPEFGGTDRDYVAYDHQEDYRVIARRAITDLEQQEVDLIIGLTHLYLQDDERLATLRAEHPGLAFIVGGHDHEMLSRMQSESSAAIFKGSSNARVIWRIDVEFLANGEPVVEATALPMDLSVEKDADYERLAAEWREELLRLYPIIDAKVGMAGVPFDVTEENIRNQETAWGNFLADTARSAFGEPHSDLAFINSGSVRIDDYIAGDITYEDIVRTFGFPSHLRRVELQGAEFVELMEAGYRGTGGSKGYFPQVSGFRICVDRSLPDFERIVSLQVPDAEGWTEIDADRSYSLVLPDFIYGDRDGYVMPPDARETASLPGPELKYLVIDTIVKAQFVNEPVGTAVDPAKPRFVELGPERETCWQ